MSETLLEQLQQAVLLNSQYNKLKEKNRKFDNIAHSLIAEALKRWIGQNSYLLEKLKVRLAHPKDKLDEQVGRERATNISDCGIYVRQRAQNRHHAATEGLRRRAGRRKSHAARKLIKSNKSQLLSHVFKLLLLFQQKSRFSLLGLESPHFGLIGRRREPALFQKLQSCRVYRHPLEERRWPVIERKSEIAPALKS